MVADRLKKPVKAYGIVEQVRGRVTSDLLSAGSVAPEAAKQTERRLSQLRLELMGARSAGQIERVRGEIFMAEQARWVTPEVSILRSRAREIVGVEQIQQALSSSGMILEYVLADPRSYCLTISQSGINIIPLSGKQRIEARVKAYLNAVEAKRSARAEARDLYDELLKPVGEIGHVKTLVVIRDGQLHLAPFDAFIDEAGLYVTESHVVVYEPSATSFYLLNKQSRRTHGFQRMLLAIGGVSYGSGEALGFQSFERGGLRPLPASRDEVLAAEAAVHAPGNTVLLGSAATEAAFKKLELGNYGIIHLAVHGLADRQHPNRAALAFLPDRASGEDGLLQPPEIVQLRLKADLVILSACDTAVGPLQGEEGIATLSRAFLLAGAKSVVSTLWSVESEASLFLMEQFYRHVAAREAPSLALMSAKRDVLKTFGRDSSPYYWAGFIFEGNAK